MINMLALHRAHMFRWWKGSFAMKLIRCFNWMLEKMECCCRCSCRRSRRQYISVWAASQMTKSVSAFAPRCCNAFDYENIKRLFVKKKKWIKSADTQQISYTFCTFTEYAHYTKNAHIEVFKKRPNILFIQKFHIHYNLTAIYQPDQRLWFSFSCWTFDFVCRHVSKLQICAFDETIDERKWRFVDTIKWALLVICLPEYEQTKSFSMSHCFGASVHVYLHIERMNNELWMGQKAGDTQGKNGNRQCQSVRLKKCITMRMANRLVVNQRREKINCCFGVICNTKRRPVV